MQAIQVFNTLQQVTRSCQAVFSDVKYAEGHQKSYTYLVSEDMDVKEGDLAIVEKAGKYSIVTIISVDTPPQINPKASFRYKWLVGHVDPQEYHDKVAADDATLEEIKRDMTGSARDKAAEKASELVSPELLHKLQKRL